MSFKQYNKYHAPPRYAMRFQNVDMSKAKLAKNPRRGADLPGASTWNPGQYFIDAANYTSTLQNEYTSLEGTNQSVVINVVEAELPSGKPNGTTTWTTQNTDQNIATLIQEEAGIQLVPGATKPSADQLNSLFYTILAKASSDTGKSGKMLGLWNSWTSDKQSQFADYWFGQINNNVSFDKQFNANDLYTAMLKFQSGTPPPTPPGEFPWGAILALGVMVGVIVYYNEGDVIKKYIKFYFLFRSTLALGS